MAFLRPRAWIAGGILALLLLAGIGLLIWHDSRPQAHPALWRISQGERHGWLFGTIHAVPQGARWLSPKIEAAVAESGVLVLEAQGLEAERSDRRVFEALGRSPGLPPLIDRVDATGRAGLLHLFRSAPGTLRNMDGYEDWAAALLISASATSEARAVTDDAPEARLEARFRSEGRAVLGLETIAAQLGLFDRLAPADQAALLDQAIAEAQQGAGPYEALYRLWAAGDVAGLEKEALAPLARYPRLRNALIDLRNALWAQRIDKLLKESSETPFIAVGAAHLAGAGSVQARLAARGWKIERVQ